MTLNASEIDYNSKKYLKWKTALYFLKHSSTKGSRMTFLEHPVSAKHFALILFESKTNTGRSLFLPSFCRWGNWQLRESEKISQVYTWINVRACIQTQVGLTSAWQLWLLQTGLCCLQINTCGDRLMSFMFYNSDST